jgi:hypothetical protein
MITTERHNLVEVVAKSGVDSGLDKGEQSHFRGPKLDVRISESECGKSFLECAGATENAALPASGASEMLEGTPHPGPLPANGAGLLPKNWSSLKGSLRVD